MAGMEGVVAATGVGGGGAATCIGAGGWALGRGRMCSMMTTVS